MKENKITYETALKELNDIYQSMEDNAIGVDELTEKLKRASDLIKICRDKLKLTEEESKKILEQFKTI
ncbi:MAG: exodeoxyribonuclease VII small subunit [Bacteroidales bacterium]|nr:exodeoxyribonuclease VII small subunit [Bacteroidales bacterium]MBR5650633.1 exodeoxyribonuclease VII small subunit [Bacteroidales bacterium]MBR5720658.1 exodeoxyribonuclease VII small subunit [Bacteroidales bacterium]